MDAHGAQWQAGGGAPEHGATSKPAGLPAYLPSRNAPFLSTLRPGAGQRRAALGVVLVSSAFFLGMVPLATVPLPPVPAFLPLYQCALVVIDLITTTLLLGQYAILRSRALLVLACAYLFSALMAVAHAASFPGLFAPQGLFGAGSQTTAWLYFLWHAGFPLLVIAYALLKGGGANLGPTSRHVRKELLWAATATAAAAVLLTALAAHAPQLLPALMAGNTDAPAKLAVATATWLVGLAALGVLWMRRPHSVIDLWLMVVLCVWAADTALAAVFNHARYDVGWYAGRVFGLLASSFVLVMLLLENSMLYARLVQANEAQRRRAGELQRLSAQLESANRDLDAFAGGLAHDLQQPITTIGAFAQAVQQHSPSGLSAREASHLARIVAAARMAQQMIRALLEFARLGQKKIDAVPVDLDALVREARAALPAEGAGVAWTVGHPLPAVHGDAALLLTALVNLLSNALKYTQGAPAPAIWIEAGRDPHGGCWIRVRDNGVGFDMAHSDRLFKPFERLHHGSEFEGTGMGLTNVRRIMERHGGSVRAESAPGQGAAFTLRFPPGPAQAQGTVPAPGLSPAA